MEPKGYVICGEPRSGSNFLCQVLASTGILGHPRDYLNVRGMRSKGWCDYPADVDGQLAKVLEMGQTANGVYGFKMFGIRFDDIVRSRWAERFPGLHFIHLEREDILGQAISDVRAMQTGQYRKSTAASGTPTYDRRFIAKTLRQIIRNQGRWRQYFARNGIAPLKLRYEEIVLAPQDTVEAVAAHIGLDERPQVRLAQVEVARQSDAISAEWRQRFIAETADTGYLDNDWLGTIRATLSLLRRRALRVSL